ncbi:MAG TPA: ATP-binding protein, partial [Patescibacteria group bacterium]|nr:ATP-binding protein [Patescibacteria group bacterium]
NSLTALNVTYSDEIKDRDLNGLIEFKEKFRSKVKELILLTKNTEKTNKGIAYIPVWKWVLLEKR